MDSTGRSFHLFQMMVISNTSTSLKNHILSENFVSKDHVNPVVITQRDKLVLIICMKISLLQLVTILLKHGANPLQPNDKGETPVDVANDINIKKLLAREIISSNSETSSIDEVRSPTSPESLASIKDEDRGIDVEGIVAHCSGLCRQ